MFLEQNLKGHCTRFGVDYQQLLADMKAENCMELSLFDLESLAEEFETDLQSLLFTSQFRPEIYKDKIDKIKLLLLDVDGVLTDGGMYVSENGDQMKRYNTKDGMGILHLTKSGFQVGIVSSGFTANMVQQRADLLGIQHCYVGREPKLEIVQKWINELGIGLENVAIIGDDINDLPLMEVVGLAVCPSNAVPSVKNKAHILLKTAGGEGCVREFIDQYLLKSPLF